MPQPSRLTGTLTNPYVMLVVTTVIWAGNSIAGKLVVGHASPMVVTMLRWTIVCVVLSATVRQELSRDWPALRPHALRLAITGALGYTAFNALFYAAAYTTTAINISIIQGAMPSLVFLLAFALFRDVIRPVQALGLGLTLVGIAVVASQGDLAVLRALAFTRGDIFMLIATSFYAIYTVMLRKRPQAGAMSLFTVMAIAAFVTSVPLVGWEAWTGTLQWPTPTGWLIILYIGLLPSLVGQVLYIHAVAKIGPSRAGLFMNLVPVLGACMGAGIGEDFGWPQVIGLVLVVGGILWAETSRGAKPVPA